MTISWLKQVPKDSFKLWDNECLTTQKILDRINCYQDSVPTGPSPGRIYSRNYKHHGWYVFIVCDDVFDDPKTQVHYPYKVVLV